ncbi:MAG: DeoR/GlpR transcriptional regulator [Chloroflexi bacterium]|nr:DeoR/GlpR transcriptional regulator [Chloroflexota bacterium]
MKPRHAEIMDLLRAENAVAVHALALRMNVSESTIRRDLAKLEEQGVLRRIHGGALLEEDVQMEPPFELRAISHRAEKDLVGRAAAALVQDGEVIFIDGGTTTPFIVPYLAERRGLTVVTCGLNVANALSRNPNIQTIVVGGELHVESQSFVGPLALEALRAYNIRCDRAFIASGGISAQHGITNRILDRIPLKRQAIEISRWVAVVADGSKIGVAALGYVAAVEAAHHLVTDPSAPQSGLDEIAARGVQVRMWDQGA